LKNRRARRVKKAIVITDVYINITDLEKAMTISIARIRIQLITKIILL